MATRTNPPSDVGYTLIEMLIVVVILGVLGSVVALSLHGLTSEAAGTGCQADRHQLSVAAEAYFAQTGADQIAGAGVDHDRFERTLANGGFLRTPSTYHDLDADGVVTP
jgi:prepilin-type N-terminal cleavage/methylation domain-containing protein